MKKDTVSLGMFKKTHIDELVASVIVTLIVWAIGVGGLELVALEGHAIANSGISRAVLLILAPIFLGTMSYFLVKWSHGYKGPAELILTLKQKSSTFPGWVRATITWIIACIELGSGLSPKGFEGPYVAAAGGLSGFLATKLSLDRDARRRLARCGLGVAFGLLFRTPLGGFICTFEFGGFEKREFQKLLPPAAIATVTNFWLVNATGSPSPFKAFTSGVPTPHQILALLLVGIVCGAAGLAYVFAIRLSRDIFKKLERHILLVFIPIIGAVVSTALGAAFPIILGSNDVSRLLIQSPATPLLIIGVIVAKILATAAADGSKMAGGTVGPAILLGGLIGGAIGGLNPLLIVAGSAALIGPIAGISLTMLLTAITWLGFSPVTLLVVIPIVLSKIICQGTELYPYNPLATQGWPRELD